MAISLAADGDFGICLLAPTPTDHAPNGNTESALVYTGCMAKVMVSIPDELLGRLDEHARRHGTSRSGLLQELAERELRADVRKRAIRRVLAGATPHGGESARQVRELRRAH